MRLDDGVAFWVERDRADWIPVASRTRPASRVLLPGPKVHRMASGQDLVIFAGVALCRRDVADAAVAVRVVGPMHETRRPGARPLKIGKAPGGKLRPLLGMAEQGRSRIRYRKNHCPATWAGR